ncbi:aldo/keto reductase [Corynebacterium sp. CCUG 65737]|uniref:aldo/keto reductase n=1 Tax=Corynebacterium sp. CCUG 65737 TaxID=2823889 RepID=UPI00210D0A1E|nr:aldo/keto reductase [Corynebacterium sp. CCUG 65737]MCQ4627330.1 aldo/keto reductase [Corynebacterium sp. CCUG 65737]
MEHSVAPFATLNDGSSLPLIGLGTYKLTGPDAVPIIRRAIELGYRHFDTASMYGNEEILGQTLREAIAAGDVTREELFVTSKVWNDDQHRAGESLEESLTRSGLDYFDLFLVHWPWPQNGTFITAYEQLLSAREAGTIRSVGVANFYEEVLAELIDATGVAPAVNQVEMHTGFTQPDLRAFHDRHGIITEAWAPLGRGEVLGGEVVRRVVDKHAESGATAAQVALAHLMAHGVSVIPKTSDPQRLEENLGAVHLELDSDDVRSLDGVVGARQSNDPRVFPG